MAKMKWLIEPEVFKEDALPLLAALDKLGVEHKCCEFGVPYEKYIAWAGLDDTVFYGSLQFGRTIQKKTPVFVTVYCTLPKYECSYYYPRFGERLMNSDYIMLCFGDLRRRKDELFGKFSELYDCWDDEFFVRPSSGYKTFTGGIVTQQEWDDKIRTLERRLDPETLVIISSPKDISKEWRMVIVDGKVVTGGQYKKDNKIVRISEVPADVFKYAQETVDAVNYCPDKAWTLDIGEVYDGLKVVEVGSFSCSGLYACDCEAVIKAINSLSEEEQND